MKEKGIDRLIALLNNHPSEIEGVVKPANDEDTLSISFTDGEVLVLTAETETREAPDSETATLPVS